VTETPRDPSPSAADEFTEEPRGAGKLIARFFLLPLVVVGAAVGIFLVFNYMTFERRGPRDYLQEVRGGTANRRWQAAFELSRSLGNLSTEERAELCAETLRVYETLGKRPDDVLVRRYLVLVLGRLGDPSAVPALIQAAKADDSDTRLYAVWALGKIGAPAGFDTVLESSQTDDAGARKMAAYVLGALGDKRAIPRLRVLAEDRVADVRWNAAVALARKGKHDGVPVLKQMLDRQYVAQTVKREVRQDEDQDPIADVMISGLRAAAVLKDEDLRMTVERLSESDSSLKVRQAALEAIKVLGAQKMQLFN